LYTWNTNTLLSVSISSIQDESVLVSQVYMIKVLVFQVYNLQDKSVLVFQVYKIKVC
jgi:hypothetical protein